MRGLGWKELAMGFCSESCLLLNEQCDCITIPPYSLQIYSKYAEVSDELIKEKEAKELVQNQLNYLIQVR